MSINIIFFKERFWKHSIFPWLGKYINKKCLALAGVAQWTEQTNGSLVQFPVRAHAWVVG